MLKIHKRYGNTHARFIGISSRMNRHDCSVRQGPPTDYTKVQERQNSASTNVLSEQMVPHHVVSFPIQQSGILTQNQILFPRISDLCSTFASNIHIHDPKHYAIKFKNMLHQVNRMACRCRNLASVVRASYLGMAKIYTTEIINRTIASKPKSRSSVILAGPAALEALQDHNIFSLVIL